MKRRDSSDDPKNSVEGPGYVPLYSHQPSTLLSDTLILDTLLYQSQDPKLPTIYSVLGSIEKASRISRWDLLTSEVMSLYLPV